ncbi:hypothetical protein BV25DRAFT_140456 [Artomyces pyxidatus]|uniref:Uncharacterized protein n=1 Tax=Artomyces pyxidatus TaxID=48021 RepID=A0ACB8T9E6_9AGAM|nr:hypothetical protein BV25DRAFT_140456 [Artomyces pyxidatus]
MPVLPVEILQTIIDQVLNGPDLYRVRATSRTFCALATPRVFHRVHATNSLKSADALQNLLLSPGVVNYVQELVYNDKYPPATNSKDAENARQAITASISSIHEFSTLKAITISFEPCDQLLSDVLSVDDEPFYHQLAILTSLAEISHLINARLTSLTINRIIPSFVELFSTPPFLALLDSVTILRLTTWVELSDELYLEETWLGFWRTSIHGILALPTLASNLTSLTLFSNVDVGIIAPLELIGLTYPRLTSLSLRHVVFHPDVGTEEFIIRHARTLTHLELYMCKIAMFEADIEPHQLWALLWARFAVELESLTHLVVLMQTQRIGRRMARRPEQVLTYSRLTEPWGHLGLDGGPIGGSADLEALEKFRGVVKARSRRMMDPGL